MKILVTGAAGFLGSATLRRLLEQGQTDLRLLIRNPAQMPKLEAIARPYPAASVEFVVGTLSAPADAARAVEGVDCIFHIAAAMRGGTADMFLNTVVGSKNLLEAVGTRKPMRIVLVSSFGVYGVSGLPAGSLVDEQTRLETHPEKRDPYSYSKLRQEQLFGDYQRRNGFELITVRPGVIYGPGGPPFSSRVGLNLFGLFLHLGGSNKIPLTYVDNCADALIAAGLRGAAGEVYNVHDDDLPTSRQYLAGYKRKVKRIRSIWVPRPVMMGLSHLVLRYHIRSKGQLPAIFTPYKTRAQWTPTRFSNAKLKAIGWTPRVSTAEGLDRTFAWLKTQETGSAH